MGIFDLLSDVKERIERQQKAKEYLRDAKKYVKDGKELYEKAYDKVMAYARETNYLLERHSQYKKQKFEEFSHDIQPVLHDFRSFNIDSKIAAMQIDASTSSHFDFGHASIVNIPTISVFDVIDFFRPTRIITKPGKNGMRPNTIINPCVVKKSGCIL